MSSSFGSRYEKARAIMRLARVHFLVPGILLYVLGVFLALCRGAIFDCSRTLFGYLIFLFAHISVSFSNDYFDVEGDGYAIQTPLSGGSGVLVKYPELRDFSLKAAFFFVAASIAFASIFTVFLNFSIVFLIFSVAGALLGWFYTAPPIKLAYRSLGELSTSLAAGFIMPGMGYFVVFGSIDIWFVLFSIPLCLYGLYFILTVEMPDAEADRMAGKNNILVKFDKRTASKISFISTLGGTLIFAIYSFQGGFWGQLDFRGIALLSLIPLLGASYGLTRNYDSPNETLCQVKLNFASMMSFLFFSEFLIFLRMV